MLKRNGPAFGEAAGRAGDGTFNHHSDAPYPPATQIALNEIWRQRAVAKLERLRERLLIVAELGSKFFLRDHIQQAMSRYSVLDRAVIGAGDSRYFVPVPLHRVWGNR